MSRLLVILRILVSLVMMCWLGLWLFDLYWLIVGWVSFISLVNLIWVSL